MASDLLRRLSYLLRNVFEGKGTSFFGRWPLLITTLVIIAFTIAYALMLNRYVLERPSSTATHKRDFFEAAETYLKESAVDLDAAAALRMIFNSVDREHDGALTRYGYVCVLEDFLVEIITDRDTENDGLSTSLIPILEKERLQEPYSKLPPEERRILVNLESAVRNNDTEIALSNLNEISDLLKIRADTLARLRSQNTWSIALAILGLVLTVLFGAAAVWGFRRSRQPTP